MKRLVLVGLVGLLGLAGCDSEAKKTQLAYDACDGVKTKQEVDLAIAKGLNARMLFPTREKARAFAIGTLSMGDKEGEELAAAIACQSGKGVRKNSRYPENHPDTFVSSERIERVATAYEPETGGIA